MLVFSIFLFVSTVSAYGLKAANREAVLAPFRAGNAFKVISGMANCNSANVRNVVNAAIEGGASHVDIACDENLVRQAKAMSESLFVCVSSVDPEKFTTVVEAGADMVEIGNFDSLYDQGIEFSADDVLKMTKRTRKLVPNTPLSVTIPHKLALSEQIDLAVLLEEAGADIIQTEGKVCAKPSGLGTQELIEIAAPTLASAFSISNAVKIPVMCASGLTDVTAPLALACGARGIGIGSMVNRLPNAHQMVLAVAAVSASIGRPSTVSPNINSFVSQAERSSVAQRSVLN